MAVIVKTPGPADDFHSGYNLINSGQTTIVKANKNMIVYQQVEIEDTGVLEIIGEVIILL